MRLPSASRLALAAACSYPWAPHAPRWPKQEESEALKRGNRIHHFCEALHNQWAMEFPSEDRRLVETISEAVASFPAYPQWYTEKAYAYDCETDTARILPGKGHRDYAAAKTSEVCGTFDVVGLDLENDLAHLRDYKSGSYTVGDDPLDSAQLLFGAVALARAHGISRVRVEYTQINEDDWYTVPRNPDVELNEFDIEDAAANIRRIYAEIKAGNQAPRPGHWCRDSFCPLGQVCPATKATLARVSAEAERNLPDVAVITSPEQAARVRVGLKLIDEKVKAWDAALSEYIRANGAVHMGGDTWFGLVEEEKESVTLNAKTAAELRELVGDEIADEVLTYKSSKSAIEDALKARQTKRGQGVKRAREVFSQMRESGSLKTSRASYPREFTPKKSGEDAA